MHTLNEDQIIANQLRVLTEAEFHEQFETVVGVEHNSTLKILHFINDLERRKSFLEMGYSSVFDYCVRKLGYSRSGAGRRIQAARCARRYPEVFGMLRTRELGIGTAALIEPVLDRQIRRSLPEDWRQPVQEKVYVQFLADEEFMKLFEEVRELIGDGCEQNIADIMRRVLTEYRERHSPVARHARRAMKNGQPGLESQRWECDSTQSRHVPDEVRDLIFVRDGGQCAFVASDGTRCQCRKGLQIDHIKPFAMGGPHDATNLRLLCGAHNRLAAETAMGKHVMQPYWRRQ